MNQDVIDIKILREYTHRRTDILIRVIELFLAEVPVDIQELARDVTQDKSAARERAHRLKVNFKMIGCESGHEALLAIEKGPDAEMTKHFDQLERLLPRVIQLLEQEKERARTEGP